MDPPATPSLVVSPPPKASLVLNNLSQAFPGGPLMGSTLVSFDASASAGDGLHLVARAIVTDRSGPTDTAVREFDVAKLVNIYPGTYWANWVDGGRQRGLVFDTHEGHLVAGRYVERDHGVPTFTSFFKGTLGDDQDIRITLADGTIEFVGKIEQTAKSRQVNGRILLFEFFFSGC